MSVVKRGKTYYVDFIVAGKRTFLSARTSDRRVAEAFEKAQRAAVIRRNEGVELAEDLTLTQAAMRLYEDKWCHQRDGLASLQKVQRLASIVGDPPLPKVNRKYLTEVIRHLRGRGLSDATVNRYLADIRTIMRKASCAWEMDLKVPHFAVTRETRGRLRVLSDLEEHTLLKLTPEHYRDFFVVLLDTGMRLGEALQITYQGNIDLQGKQINLHADQVKGKRPRSIPMTDRVLGVLTKLQAEGRAFKMTKSGVEQAWQKVRREMGLEHDKEFVPHSLRHSFCTRLLQRGVSIEAVKLLAGHANLVTTERYVHLANSDLHKAVEVLN